MKMHDSRWKGARRGQVMPVFALILVVLMGAATLGIDLSRVRAEAESAQRAANAAALAGVVYLPDFKDSAYTRASQEARKNGYISGQKSVTVTPSTVPGYGGRLKVTINEPAPSIFGHTLGIFPQTISRSATAEYDLPLQLGSPDYVLGYAPFPTTVVTSTGAPSTPVQDFYLAQRGRYDLQELGDAYSPYYESINNQDLGYGWGYNNITASGPPADSSKNYPDPCKDGTNSVIFCPGLKLNPDRPANYTGYDYVVDDPITNTLVIKLFDPYDEIDYNNYCHWNGSSCDRKNPPDNSYGNMHLSGAYNDTNKLIDGYGETSFGHHPTTLEFTLSGPYQTPRVAS